MTRGADTMHYLCVTLVIISCSLEAQALRGYGHVNRRYSAPRVKKDITCDPTYKYRSYDGSCNNLDHPEYGMIGAAFRRILDPVYEDKVSNTPRLKAASGNDLPSPRSVSTRVHDPENFTMPFTNQMLMQWAQFLDHDITWTPTEDDPGDCCDNTESLVTNGELHPHVTNGGACFPIIIDDGDRYFDTVSTRCMNFVRSAHVTDSNGVWQQYNAITPWIDGSQVYGYTEDLAKSLRSFTDGKLAVNTIDGEDFLPRDDDAGDETCFLIEGGDYCFLAGDHRVNVFPGLSALHTIFVRYHNMICDRLKALHSEYDDETLYQEARRIVIAVMQKITYDEFMQQLLSRHANDYDLFFGDSDYKYDNSIDPTLPNVFSTAAYRFGHSLVTDSLTIGGTIYETGLLYMRPMYVLNSLKDVIEAIIGEISQRADRWYSEGITDKMFEKPSQPKTGYDIAARNIQRGRDHGLPPYNDWRQHYGLSRRASFDEMDMGRNRLARVYESVDDIDLYTGAISENPFNGAKVGELYIKILGNQFRDLKFGDRFWFENTGDVSSFTDRQIRQIRRMSLARVICDTVSDITQIQAKVFRVVDTRNPVVDCSTINDMDIERFW